MEIMYSSNKDVTGYPEHIWEYAQRIGGQFNRSLAERFVYGARKTVVTLDRNLPEFDDVLVVPALRQHDPRYVQYVFTKQQISPRTLNRYGPFFGLEFITSPKYSNIVQGDEYILEIPAKITIRVTAYELGHAEALAELARKRVNVTLNLDLTEQAQAARYFQTINLTTEQATLYEKKEKN